MVMELAGPQPATHAGRPEREKALEAERPYALVTVAVMVTPV
jgi:hypothetical protein